MRLSIPIYNATEYLYALGHRWPPNPFLCMDLPGFNNSSLHAVDQSPCCSLYVPLCVEKSAVRKAIESEQMECQKSCSRGLAIERDCTAGGNEMRGEWSVSFAAVATAVHANDKWADISPFVCCSFICRKLYNSSSFLDYQCEARSATEHCVLVLEAQFWGQICVTTHVLCAVALQCICPTGINSALILCATFIRKW